MIPLIPVLIIGGVIWASLRQSAQSPQAPKKNIAQLAPPAAVETETSESPPENSLLAHFSNWDQNFQHFIQTHLDTKIIGETRHQQMLELSGGRLPTLSPQEHHINHRLLLGTGALGLLTAGYLTDFTVTPLVLAIAAFNFIPLLQESWRVATEERRFSLLHLLVMYFGYMWGTGHYLIGTLGALLFNLNRKILLLSQTTTRSSLVQLLGEQPQRIFILINGVEIETPFEQLQIGDILVLQAGQHVPVDGTILQGSVAVDQHRLTGESQPVEKSVGDTLFASTLILSGRTQVQVEKTGAATTAAKISSILKHTVEVQQTTIADQFRFLESTKWFMLAGSGLGWYVAGTNTAVALLGCNFLTTMVPLKLITLLNGLKSSAEQGILIKDGRVLEKLPQITTIVFDKTGTLTLAQPRVATIYCEPGYQEDHVLTLAAAAEQRQNHPIAQAILTAAKERYLQLPPLELAEYQLGLGLKVQINGQSVRVGSERFLNEEQLVLPDSLQQQQNIAHEQGDTLVFVAINTQIVAAIKLIATLRPDVQEMLHWFKQRGLKLYILSGDQEAPTRKLAEQLEVTGYFANTLPEQKAQRIRALQAQGQQVCFIGDGINDAIALCQAEVSISLRGATTIATDTAQIVLMNDHLAQITSLWQVAQNYQNNISHNTYRAQQFSLTAATGVILLPYKFWIVEGMWVGQILTGVHIANQPLLDTEKSPKTLTHS